MGYGVTAVKGTYIENFMSDNSIEVKEEDWSEIAMPEYLRVNYRVIDQQHNVLDHGKDLKILKKKFAPQTELAFNQVLDEVIKNDEIAEWNFGDLPISQKISVNESIITIYPSLIDEDGKIYKHAFDNLETAEYYLKYGLRSLFKRSIPKEVKYLRNNLRGIEKLALLYSGIGSKDELVESVVRELFSISERNFSYIL